MTAKAHVAIACAALCAGASTAHAEVLPYGAYAWGEDHLASRIGIDVVLGGGFGGFTDEVLRDQIADTTGVWGLRLSLGTHIPLGIDLSYTGLATDLDTFGPTGDATLIGTTVEGALRWNVLPHYAWTPYLFGGAGWQRFDVTDIDFSLAGSGITEQDDIAVFPLGGGIAYRDPSGFVLDLRGTWRHATESDLITDRAGTVYDLDTWDATASVGVEF